MSHRIALSHTNAFAKNAKAAFVVLALGLCLLLACACSSSKPAGNANQQASDAPQTRQITDVYGRTVEIPTDVQTCATVGSAARFVVYAGGQDKLIAVTQMDTPASPTRPYTMVWEAAFTELPTTSNGNHLMETSVDGEALLGLAPDVIISSRSAQECDALQAQIGIPVVGISYQDQMFTYDVMQSILVVGDVLGTSQHAQDVVAKMEGWQQDLSDRTANTPEDERPTCYAGAVNYKGAKSFGGTYANYPPFEAVNILNVADSTGQTGSVEVTLEQLGEWNPDFMFLNAANLELLRQDYANNPAFFDSLKAFQTGNIYTQPSYNMNGTNVELAICDAYFDGATVYPDAFADVDLPAKYAEIFTTMLGADYYEQMQSQGAGFGQIPVRAFS